MKNRRLNVLFIAIIALAAAPQALQDIHRLANAVQDRAETEFWSVFLSYQTPAANGAETKGATELLATRGSGSMNSCPLERIGAQTKEATRNSQTNENSTPARSSQEIKRTSFGAQVAASAPIASQPVEPNPYKETLASVYTVRAFEFSDEEKEALKALNLHARDTEKLADIASKASVAPFLPGDENLQIKMKQAVEMDKVLRQRVRYTRDRSESRNEIPAPNPNGGM